MSDTARPRSFRSDQVVEEAKAAFWSKGYHGTVVEDLERTISLNRSSLYGAVSSKKAAFDLDLAAYLDSFVARGSLPWNAQGQSEATSNGSFSAPLAPTH